MILDLSDLEQYMTADFLHRRLLLVAIDNIFDNRVH